MKICKKCKQEKELNDFPNNIKSVDGKSSYCRECMKAYHKARKAKYFKTEKEDYEHYSWYFSGKYTY